MEPIFSELFNINSICFMVDKKSIKLLFGNIFCSFSNQGANPVYVVQQNQGVSKPEAQMPKVVSIVLASFLIFLAIVAVVSQVS